MRFREYDPHPVLQEFVKCFWILEMEYPKGGVQDVMPDGCVELICNFGAPYALAGGRVGAPLPEAFLVGFQKRALQFRVEGQVRVVAARLFPWGALALISEQSAGGANRVCALDAEWNALTAQLRGDISGGRYDEAAARMQEFLIQRMLVHTFDRRTIQAAAKLLLNSKGQYRIEELAEMCHLGVRQLQRDFPKVVGTTPKGYARTVRFDHAQRRLMFDPEANLTELAYECGYFDQAHFIKDFKAFSGNTPGEYAERMRRLQVSLADENVVFLQEDGDPPR